MTTNVTEFNDTLVQLEKLHEAYSVILEQAKVQLENLEPSPSVIEDISKSLKDDAQFRRNTADIGFRMLTDALSDGDAPTTYVWSNLINDVAKAVLLQIKRDLKEEVLEPAMKEACDSYQINRMIQKKIEEHEAIKSAVVVQHGLARLLNNLPDQN